MLTYNGSKVSVGLFNNFIDMLMTTGTISTDD